MMDVGFDCQTLRMQGYGLVDGASKSLTLSLSISTYQCPHLRKTRRNKTVHWG